MSKRLVKVAKELNVGTKTIVEFLNGKGFSVSNKPTAKISDEMYGLLAENFQSSIAIKEQANQITIGTRKTKEEQLKEEEAKNAEKTVDSIDELFKKPEPTPVEEPISTDIEKEKREEPVVETTAPQLTGPKILGKINLDNSGRKPKKNKTVKKEEAPKPKQEPVQEKTPEKEPVVVKEETPKKEEKTETTPPVAEKTSDKPIENQTPKEP